MRMSSGIKTLWRRAGRPLSLKLFVRRVIDGPYGAEWLRNKARRRRAVRR